MGNAILQSGTAIGSMVTPLILYLSLRYVPNWQLGGWRLPFWFAGVCGALWCVVWLLLIRPGELDNKTLATDKTAHDVSRWGALSLFRDPRMWALCVLVVSVNSTWHFFRAWTPLFLQDARGYHENTVFWFSMAYYGAADAGAMACGFLTLFIINRGMPVHRSRMLVFLLFACVALLSIPVALIDRGPLLLVMLVILGFAALGVFPNYYAFTQELTTKHQGKVSGILGFVNWVAMFFLQAGVGTYVKNSKDRHITDALAAGMPEADAILHGSRLTYEMPLALAGIGPLIGFVVMLILYRPGTATANTK